MTNHDFWMSISDIINEGFTSEGLAKLDDYAEQFSTGKILYKRFSPSEQLGCVKGGTIHVIASLLAGAEVGTDQLSAPEQQNQKVSWKAVWKHATYCFSLSLVYFNIYLFVNVSSVSPSSIKHTVQIIVLPLIETILKRLQVCQSVSSPEE